MKVTLNLSLAPSVRDRYALAWAVPITIVGLASLVLVGRASLQEYREFRVIEQQVLEVETHVAALQSQEAAMRRTLDDPASRDLLQEARFINKLIDQRQLSLSALTARVTNLLPEDAHLTGLALTAPRKPGDDPMVRIGVNAKNEEAVEDLINDLEDAPDFKDVSILNQGFQEESSQGEQVNIVCTARYLAAAAPAPEEASAAPEAKPEKANAGNPKAEAGSKKLAAGGKKLEAGNPPATGGKKLEPGIPAAGVKGPKPSSMPPPPPVNPK